MTGENLTNRKKNTKSMTQEEINHLFKLMKSGNFEARQRLIEGNMKLVPYRVYNNYNNVNHDKDELISIGYFGLIKAVDNYDPTKGLALSTFAIKCIDNEINMFLRKFKKVQTDISLEHPIKIKQKGDELRVEDFLSDDFDIEEEYINAETAFRIREIVKKLPPLESEIISLHYGFNNGKIYTLAEIAAKTNFHRSTVIRHLTNAKSKIKKELENQDQQKSRDLTSSNQDASANIEYKLSETKPHGKTFYELLSDFSKEDVDNVVKGLSEENKSIIMQRYREGLDSHPTKYLDNEIKKRFYVVLSNVKRKLTAMANGKKTRFKCLYDNFPEYSKSQVDQAVSILDDAEKQLVQTRYNGNFNNRPTGKFTRQQSNHFYSVTIPKIKRIIIHQEGKSEKANVLPEQNLQKQYSRRTFYELLESYPKEWVDEAFECLSKEEKQIVFDRYSGDLNSLPVISMNEATSSKIHKSIIPKIKRIIAVKHSGKNPGKTIYEYFCKYSKNQIDKAIASLSDEEKKVIYLRYDGDLNNSATGKLTKAQSRKFYSYIVPKIKNNLIVQDLENQNALPLPKPIKPITGEIEELTKADYQKILELIKNKDFAYIIYGFKPKEIMMIILLLGYINSKSYSISTIAKFLEISESEAISAGKSALEKFKQRINQIMEGEDFSTCGAILPTEKDSGSSPFHM